MKKILFVIGYNRNNIYRRMNLELLISLASNPENEVYILDCNGQIKGYCWCSKDKANKKQVAPLPGMIKCPKKYFSQTVAEKSSRNSWIPQKLPLALRCEMW